MQTRKRRANIELNQLAKHLQGRVEDVDGIHTLFLNEETGSGKVRCVNFDAGLTVMEFDVTLNSDVTLPVIYNAKSIYFLYCMRGGCFYLPKDKANIVKLNELQSAILGIEKPDDEKLIFQKGEKISLNLIRIDTDHYFNRKNTSAVGSRFGDFLSEFEQRNSLVHLGRMNLEISELLKKLEQAKYADTLSELLYFEGVCILILASHIGQYRAETNGKTNSTSLIKRELKIIMQLADEITEMPEQPYSLDGLCRESGLSAAKLQEGFKFLYQRTVSDFIRNTRLERAEKLLRETDMNISEVVYSIGLTSRSYFCKIFKAKFKCNPKSYKNKSNILSDDLVLRA